MPKVSLVSEIFLGIESSSSETLRLQLENGLRNVIERQKLAVGAALPSTRILADQLGVSRGLVVSAYEQLISEGYLIATSGSATRVLRRTDAEESDLHRLVCVQSEFSAVRYNFSPSRSDASLFPKRAWLSAARRAITDASSRSLTRPEVQGEISSRVAIARYLNRTRATLADPANVVMCIGGTQGMRLVCQALRMRGVKRVAIETPSCKRHSRIIESEGLDAISISVDVEGMRIQDLWETDAEAVFLTPAAQYPTGYVLSEKRRTQLVAWARERNALIIENDYGSEYKYEQFAAGAIQGVAPDHTIYIGTASKILAPGMRLAWLIVPQPLIQGIVSARLNESQGSSVFDQLAFAEFIERGDLDGHLRKMRGIYKRRRGLLLAAINRHLPQFSSLGSVAGLQIMVEMPENFDAVRIASLAQLEGIELTDAFAYCIKPVNARPAFTLGYGCLDDDLISDGVKKIAEIVRLEYGAS